MFRSIRWRIAVPYVALILFTMLGLNVYLSDFVRQTRLDKLETELAAEAWLVSETIRPLLVEGASQPTLQAQLVRLAGQLDQRLTLIALDGTVLAESHADATQMENHANRPEVQQALTTGTGTSIRFSRTLGYDTFYAAARVQTGDQAIGAVRIAVPLQQIDAEIAMLQRTILIVTLLIAGLAVLLAIAIAERLIRPLRQLTEAARQMATGDLHTQRLPVTRHDEVGQLTQAFNAMATQMHKQIDVQEAERSKLAAVLQEMNDAVAIVNPQGQIELLNQAARRIFSIDAAEVLGHSLVEVFRYHQIFELWQQCHDTGAQQVVFLELPGMVLQGVATELGDVLPGSILLLFQDLTRLHHLETVRRDFISNISHELRTPLASLKALAETLQAGALDDPPAARRFLARMDAEVDALTQMVSELRELSRIESGKVPVQLQPTAPVDMLADATERLRLQAERAELSVQIDCPDTLLPVWADPPRMSQVVVNLLHNAIKFTPAGGRITLAARPENDTVVFSVRDTGIGIPADDLLRIFERFYKTDRARTKAGTGLGLAIARHLVEAHDGRIWVESQEDQGSTFYFSLPVVQ